METEHVYVTMYGNLSQPYRITHGIGNSGSVAYALEASIGTTRCDCTLFSCYHHHHSKLRNMDRASQVLAQGLPPGVPRTYAALAEHGAVALSTLQHRPRGRRSQVQKA